MRLFRCLLMIFATLAMASLPVAAKPGHPIGAGQARHHAHAAVAAHGQHAVHAMDAGGPCPGHHAHGSHDGGCCGNACCGPSCFSPAATDDGAVVRVSRNAAMPRPRPDAAPRGTLFALLDRPPIAG